MRELKGETTVFYSTHILDDVQRVSDHVAILDHGRLVKAAPTHVLLGSFTANTLRVVLGGAKGATEVGMREIPGVASVTVVSRSGDETAYDVVTQAGASATVQREITLFAVDAGLTLIANAEETLDLETVFLRLIDQKEVGRMTADATPIGGADPAGRSPDIRSRRSSSSPSARRWAMTGLLSVSLLFGLVALFGPAVGAVVVSWADGSLVELRQRLDHVAVAAVLPGRPRHPVRRQRRGRRPAGRSPATARPGSARSARSSSSSSSSSSARRPAGEGSCCRGCAAT